MVCEEGAFVVFKSYLLRNRYLKFEISPQGAAMSDQPGTANAPWVCLPWTEKLKELPEITGDKELAQKVWEDIDSLAYVYIWHCVLSF
jgi:hypothetical protein